MPKKHENEAKYLHAPDWELIRKYMKKLRVNMSQFERLFGIPSKTLHQVKIGNRQLPVRFWHIIYERVAPPMVIKEAKKLIKAGFSTNQYTQGQMPFTYNHAPSDDILPAIPPEETPIPPEETPQKNPSPSHDRLRFLKKK